MITNPTVSSAYLKSFYLSALQFGVPKANLPELPDGGLKGLDVRTRRYPVKTFMDVIDAAYRHTKDTAIGLRFGLNLRPERNIDVIYALTFCENLKEAMELNIAYQPLIQQIGSTELVITDNRASCIWKPHNPDQANMGFMTEAVLAGYASIGRWLLWTNDPPIKEMRFTHTKPDNLEIHHTVFGQNLHFGAKTNELIFHIDALRASLPGQNPNMVKRLRVQMDQMLENLKHPNSLKEDVKSQIKAGLGSGPVNIDIISAQLSTSERTLRRRLTQDNTSFRELLSQSRRESAEIYMADPRMSLVQIAQALSFADQSSFSRAFKEWFDVSPRAYRHALQSETVDAP